MGGQSLYHPACTPSDLIVRATQHVHEQVQDSGVFEDSGEGFDAGVGTEYVGSVKERGGGSGAHTLLQLTKGPLNQGFDVCFHLPQHGFVEGPGLCRLLGRSDDLAVLAQHLVAVSIDLIVRHP